MAATGLEVIAERIKASQSNEEIAQIVEEWLNANHSILEFQHNVGAIFEWFKRSKRLLEQASYEIDFNDAPELATLIPNCLNGLDIATKQLEALNAYIQNV